LFREWSGFPETKTYFSLFREWSGADFPKQKLGNFTYELSCGGIEWRAGGLIP